MSTVSPSSNILEQAVLDAKKLKEFALEQAQSKIIEEHAVSVQELYKQILNEAPEDELGLGDEEDDLGMGDELGMGDDLEFEDDLEFVDDTETAGIDDQVPYSFADGEELCACPDDDEEIEIDFDELMSRPEDTESHEAGAEDMFSDLDGGDEEIELDDEMLEALVADVEEKPSGWSPRPEKEWETETDKRDARENHSDEDDDDDRRMEKTDAARIYTRDDYDDLKESFYKLKNLLSKYENKVEELNEKYQKEKETNRILKNRIEESVEFIEALHEDRVKLSYQVKVLEDSSLNERQKRKLVEHISNATTADAVEQVYSSGLSIISETQQPMSQMSLSKVDARQSIVENNDRVNKSIVLKGQRREDMLQESQNPDDAAFFTRMRKNAGLIE